MSLRQFYDLSSDAFTTSFERTHALLKETRFCSARTRVGASLLRFSSRSSEHEYFMYANTMFLVEDQSGSADSDRTKRRDHSSSGVAAGSGIALAAASAFESRRTVNNLPRSAVAVHQQSGTATVIRSCRTIVDLSERVLSQSLQKREKRIEEARHSRRGGSVRFDQEIGREERHRENFGSCWLRQ